MIFLEKVFPELNYLAYLFFPAKSGDLKVFRALLFLSACSVSYIFS